MATFYKDDIIINMMLSATMFSKSTNEVLFSATMLEEPSLELGGEKAYVTDNYGMNIAAFNRQKTCTFSATNSLFSLGMLANQFGATPQTGSDILIPAREILKVASGNTVSLKHAPRTGSVSIDVLDDSRSSIGVRLTESATGSGVAVQDKKITITSDDVKAGTLVAVHYTYAGDAVRIANKTDSFTAAGEFRIEILFCDKCDQMTQYYGFLVFPNAALDNNATINLTSDGKHAFSVEALVDYCSEGQELCYVVVPDSK